MPGIRGCPRSSRGRSPTRNVPSFRRASLGAGADFGARFRAGIQPEAAVTAGGPCRSGPRREMAMAWKSGCRFMASSFPLSARFAICAGMVHSRFPVDPETGAQAAPACGPDRDGAIINTRGLLQSLYCPEAPGFFAPFVIPPGPDRRHLPSHPLVRACAPRTCQEGGDRVHPPAGASTGSLARPDPVGAFPVKKGRIAMGKYSGPSIEKLKVFAGLGIARIRCSSEQRHHRTGLAAMGRHGQAPPPRPFARHAQAWRERARRDT